MAVLEDISADLDLLGGTRPGNLMMRGTSLWEALVPGSAGQVLTSNGPDNEASYQPGAGVAAASWTSQQGTDGQSATAAASKGLMIQPTVPIIIYAVGTTGALTSGHSYRVQILDMGTGVIVQSIKAISQSYTMPTPNLGFFSLNFIVPPTLTPDRRWYISCARVDGANNFAVPFHIASTNGWIPGIPSQRIAVSPFWQVPGHIVKRIPTGGDTLITAGAERINMSLLVAA